MLIVQPSLLNPAHSLVHQMYPTIVKYLSIFSDGMWISSEIMEQQESIEIMKVKKFPSSDEFISQIKPRNIHDLFNGRVNDWKAFHKCSSPTAGLDYLQLIRRFMLRKL
nr:hypothetical protein [Tanacetum cinerariifolium]